MNPVAHRQISVRAIVYIQLRFIACSPSHVASGNITHPHNSCPLREIPPTTSLCVRLASIHTKYDKYQCFSTQGTALMNMN